MDWLELRRDIDATRVGVIAMSLGGYYAPRAAAFEPRLACCVAWGAHSLSEKHEIEEHKQDYQRKMADIQKKLAAAGLEEEKKKLSVEMEELKKQVNGAIFNHFFAFCMQNTFNLIDYGSYNYQSFSLKSTTAHLLQGGKLKNLMVEYWNYCTRPESK